MRPAGKPDGWSRSITAEFENAQTLARKCPGCATPWERQSETGPDRLVAGIVADYAYGRQPPRSAMWIGSRADSNAELLVSRWELAKEPCEPPCL